MATSDMTAVGAIIFFGVSVQSLANLSMTVLHHFYTKSEKINFQVLI